MEMNKEETGKEWMKTKRKEGIKRAAQPSQRQEVIYLMYLWAIFFNVSTQHSFSALP